MRIYLGTAGYAAGHMSKILPAALTAARLHQDANLAEQKAARERFDSLKAAYEVLRNPETRRQYDQGNPVRPV